MEIEDKEANVITFICDNCGKSEKYLTCDNGEAPADLLAKGWSFRKINGEWRNFCHYHCGQEFEKKRRKHED